jgi:type I restriction enzyme S subunit
VLRDLIDAMCPQGVKFKALDEIGTIYSGLTGKSKADFADGNAGFVTYVNIFNNIATDVSPDDTVQVSEGERQNRVRYGDVLFTASSESAEEVGMSSAVTVTPPEPLYLNSFCFGFRPNDAVELDPEFAKHMFRSAEVRRQVIRTAYGVTRINISKQRFRGIRIPVPPLEVQREVVRILDSFTELDAELEAELEARRRQYAYYRDQLLTLLDADRVRRIPMRELTVTIASGKNKLRVSEGKYPVYGSTGLLGYCDHAAYSGDALLVARVGANAGLVNAVRGDFDVSDNTLVVRPTAEWDLRFAFHQLTKMNLNQYAVGGGQPLVTGGLLKRLEIPVPPPDEQKRIAAALDKFDALANDLSIGLPAELNARRQQYEHYRDRLLTFPEAA